MKKRNTKITTNEFDFRRARRITPAEVRAAKLATKEAKMNTKTKTPRTKNKTVKVELEISSNALKNVKKQAKRLKTDCQNVLNEAVIEYFE